MIVSRKLFFRNNGPVLTIVQKQWTCDDDWFANDFWPQVSLTPLMRIHTPDTNFKN
jgi:hypothetical protein